MTDKRKEFEFMALPREAPPTDNGMDSMRATVIIIGGALLSIIIITWFVLNLLAVSVY